MAKKKAAKKAPAAKKATREVLVVASKVKEYIKSQGGKDKLLVAGDFAANLSDAVHILIDNAIKRAQANKRSTVQPKDI